MGEQKSISRIFLSAADTLVNLIAILALALAGMYAGYALWDNNRIYSAAEDVRSDMIQWKPVIDEDGGASFEELLAVNPDVCAWVTLDRTSIDYPVLQGETNLTYINTDVYGNFALAGSIFLDSRNSNDFSDPYSLLYGHHMENSGMFGDLDLYKDEAFFAKNTTGTLILPGQVYNLEIYACLVISASDQAIFEPERWQAGIDGLLAYAEKHAVLLNRQASKKIAAMEQPQVLGFSTCATEFTDARTIILAVMESRAADQEVNENEEDRQIVDNADAGGGIPVCPGSSGFCRFRLCDSADSCKGNPEGRGS